MGARFLKGPPWTKAVPRALCLAHALPANAAGKPAFGRRTYLHLFPCLPFPSTFSGPREVARTSSRFLHPWVVHWLLKLIASQIGLSSFSLALLRSPSQSKLGSHFLLFLLPPYPVFHLVFLTLSSVQFSRAVVSDSATPWTAARQASLSITNSRSLLKLMSIEFGHRTISSSVVPFSCLQAFPASGSFLMSHPFASGGQSIGASASALFLTSENMWGRISFFHYISLQFKSDSAGSKTWIPVSCSLLVTFTLQGLVSIKWNNACRTVCFDKC